MLLELTLAMNTLTETVGTMETRFAIGSFILAASGLPLQIPFAQIPAVWAQASDLSTGEAIPAAVLGLIIRVFSAFALAWVLTPLCV